MAEVKCLNRKNITDAIEALGISGRDVCIHASIRSFKGKLTCGIEGIVDEFLQHNCTIMVPTFSDIYEGKPVPQYMPERNGAGDYSFFLNREYEHTTAFSIDSKEITIDEMGTFPKYVLDQPGSIRGNNALNSFAALGNNAAWLVKEQSNKNVYAPFEKLCSHDGYVLLIGVGLESASIIHYAEQVSGRTPFIRWTFDENNTTIPVSAGSCSDGFSNFTPFLKNIARRVKVGESVWTCYEANPMVNICSREIRVNPSITHCKNSFCNRCNDMVLGGPIVDKSFWQ